MTFAKIKHFITWMLYYEHAFKLKLHKSLFFFIAKSLYIFHKNKAEFGKDMHIER